MTDFDNPLQPMRNLLGAFHSTPRNRLELERLYGVVWDADEFARDFEMVAHHNDDDVVEVRRKSDGQRGVISYQDDPRFYYCFLEAIPSL
jgi:hypothetical protein